MLFIAHRGNINGPSLEENKPDYIISAIEKGYDVETDIWLVNNTLFLGHDKPQYEIDLNFLEKYKDKLWCHAKNMDALHFLLENKLHCFWHQEDDYTITSKGIVWAYPNKQTTGIYVMPERNNTLVSKDSQGVCTDYPEYYKENLSQIPFTFGIITDGNNDNFIKTIVSSIESQVPIYEIIIVGNSKIVSKNTVVIPFNETIKKAWITKKKNIVAQNAKYNNLVLLHDYITFSENWYLGFLKYYKENGDFEIISNKILNSDNTRFRDWCFFPLLLKGQYNITKHPNSQKIIETGCLLPYDFVSNDKINKYIYYSGSFFIVKKDILVKYPLDEKKGWGEGEDVEWSKLLSDNKYIFKFNKYSEVKFLKLKETPAWQKDIDLKLI